MLNNADLVAIFEMGKKIRWLMDCSFEPDRYIVKGRTNVIENLQVLRGNFEYISTESFSTSWSLEEIDKFIKKLNREYKKDDRLKTNDAEELNKLARAWYDRAANIINNKISIDIPSHSIINQKLLLFGAKAFFNEGELKKINEGTLLDLDDSCSCLLVGIPTASAIMALRAVESMLKEYYKKITTKNPQGMEWGPMTNEIKKLPNHNKDLITHLDNLRKNLRNKSMHPERRFEQREMEELFVTVIKTVADISKEL